MSDFTIGILLLIALLIGFVLIMLKMIHYGTQIFQNAVNSSNPQHRYVYGMREDEDE